MSDTTKRYIEIDIFIRDRKNNTAKALASHFNLSERQIKRDIKTMIVIHNAPIKAFGKQGYCYTDEHWFFPAIGLNEQDIFTLGLASRTLEQYKGTPLHEQLRSIFDKLTRYVDRSELTIDPAWLSKDITLTSTPCRHLDIDIWNTALQCLKKRCVIKFKYQAPGANISTRTIEIWHCLHWNGDWYVLGKDLSAEKVKMFALSRFKNIKETEEQYSIPDDFSLDKYIDPEMGLFTNEGKNMKIKVRFSKESAPYAAERTWHSKQKFKSLSDGTLELEFQTNQLEQTASWLLGWGKSVLVLEPTELLTYIKTEIKEMHKIYQK